MKKLVRTKKATRDARRRSKRIPKSLGQLGGGAVGQTITIGQYSNAETFL